MLQLPRPAGSNHSVDKTSNKKLVTVTLSTDSILYIGSPGSGSCSSAVPSAQAAFLRSCWHNSVASQRPRLCVCAPFMHSLSSATQAPRDLLLRVTLKTPRPALHNEPPFSSQRWTERGRKKKKKKTHVLPDIKLPISPSFPLICMLRRLCPHPPAATGPPVCRRALKQTHLAHIPQLRRTGVFTVSEPLPEKGARSIEPGKPSRHEKNTKSTSLS